MEQQNPTKITWPTSVTMEQIAAEAKCNREACDHVPCAVWRSGREAAERRIVEWLRSEAAAAYGRSEPESGLDYRLMSDRIERGEHRG